MAQDSETETTTGKLGQGVDFRGKSVGDPTQNVLDIVKAESKYQDSRHACTKEIMDIQIAGIRDQFKIVSEGLVTFQNAMRDSETRRIDQLAANRQEFMNTIRDMLAESVRTTSTLVGNQLVQIQATFDTRVTKLEAYQLTQAGRTSVSDPATSEALTSMANAIKNLGTSRDVIVGRDKETKDHTGYIFAFIGMGVAILTLALLAFRVVT